MPSIADRRLDLDLARRSTDRVVAGVAGGVADRLGVSTGYVRAAFVVLSALWGIGIVLYMALWMATFETVEDRTPPVLGPQQEAGIGLMFAGGLFLFRGLGWWPGDPVMVMIVTLSFGLAVLGDFDWMKGMFDPDGARPSRLRLVGGGVLLAVGLVFMASSVSRVRSLGAVATAVILTAVGIVLVFGPWLVTLVTELMRERRERIRQEEKAEMAAHLHDSVLQTLALMQRTDDPKRMVTLARQQERELRSWLYSGEGASSDEMFAPALQQAAARIEGDFSVPVEVVTVGDARYTEVARSLVAAASEAIVNAAKHSGAGEVSVYAEVSGDRADVWVADRGAGFNPQIIPEDRRGLQDSIQGRLARVGGGAVVDSTVGEGTEVHMWGPVEVPEGSTGSSG